jgi:hypothetical protein
MRAGHQQSGDRNNHWDKVRELLLMALSRFDYDLADDPQRSAASIA